MTGHWYLRFWRDGETVEFAVPARFEKLKWRDEIRRLTGWSYIDSTWRASFDQRSLPSDSQPSYGQLNAEQVRQPLFRNGEPTEASSDPLLVEREAGVAE